MAPPNNPNVVRVSVIGNRDTREIVNTFHVANSAGWNLSSMQQLANDFQNWLNTSFKGLIPPVYFINTISVRSYDPVAPLAYDQSIVPPIQGTRGAAAEAGNVSVTISWRTLFAGRKFRGRTYMPGLAESDVNVNDTISSSLVAGLLSVAQAYLTAMLTGTRSPVIWHKNTNLYTQILGFVIENVVDSQRRRLPGRGR